MRNSIIIGHAEVLEDVYLLWLNGKLSVPIEALHTIDFVLNEIKDLPDIYEWSKTNITILSLSEDNLTEVLELQRFYKNSITLTETITFYFARHETFSVLAPDDFFSEATSSFTYYGVDIIEQDCIIRKEAAM